MWIRNLVLLSVLVFLSGMTASCGAGEGASPGPGGGGGEDDGSGEGPTYYEDIASVFGEHCVSCHREGQVGPFALDTFEAAFDHRAAIAASVASGSMPPWAPADDCNSYGEDRSLDETTREMILAWATGDAAEGDPALAEEIVLPEALELDLSLELPSAYTPQASPDDYRCMVVEWPEEEPSYITGFQVRPDQTEIVHHVVVFAASPGIADDYRAMDAESELEGYECFGGPGGDGVGLAAGMRWIASWAPGGGARHFPEGTGIEIQPGSAIIVQMHYNTIEAEPRADRSAIEFELAESVEREALVMPFTDLGWVLSGEMNIPAGEASVIHETSRDVSSSWLSFLGSGIGLGNGDSFEIHSVAQHMHLLGRSGRTWVERADGSKQCLLQLDDWDFGWQESYQLTESLIVNPGDKLHLRCEWDNSAEAQPVIDGEQAAPIDVVWGEGTRDEMCLGVYYITAVN